MTECTALTQPPPDSSSSSENVIEDILFLNNDFWAEEPPAGPQSKSHRLNSYEDLSSPESHLSSHRSRVSSGEDDFGENLTCSDNISWEEVDSLKLANLLPATSEYDPSLTDLNALLEGTQTKVAEMEDLTSTNSENNVEWTYLEPAQPSYSTTVEEVTIPIRTINGYQPQHHWEVNNTYNNHHPAVIVQPAWPSNPVQMEPPAGPQIHPAEIHYQLIETVHHHPKLTGKQRVVNPRKMQSVQSATKSKARNASNVETNPRICHVCGEQAGKHSYYGGQVCPSCRAFFRRSVQSKYSDIYKCSKGGQCVITLKTRKNCQFCRFQACEKAGMKRSWVLADGEVKSKKAGAGAPVSPSSSMVSSTTSIISSSLSTEDETKIRDCIEKMQMVKQQTEDLNPQVTEEFVHLMKNGSSVQLSRESRCAIKKILEQRSRLFALSVPEFTSLSSNDQVVLQEENLGPLIELRIATFFHTEIKARQQVNLILGQGDVLRITSSLAGMDHTLDNQHLVYEQFFTMVNRDQVSEEDQRLLQVMSAHKSLLQKISKWVEDETTFCLMNLILLFSAGESRKQLKDPLKVEAYQLYFTQLLHRYLCSRYNKTRARSKLAEGIRLVSHCRELHQLAALRCSMTRKISESQSSTTSSSGSEDN